MKKRKPKPKPATIGAIMARYEKDPGSVTLDELKTVERIQKMKAKPADPAAWRFLNREQAAECLDQSVMNVDKLLKEKKIQRGGKGQIDLISLCEHLRTKATKSATSAKADALTMFALEKAAKFRDVKAELATMELERQAGRLISVGKVETNYNTAAGLLQSLLAELVTRLPEKLAGQSVRETGAILEKETLQLLADYSAQLRKAAGV